MCAVTHVEGRAQLVESALSFHLYVGSRDSTQVTRLAPQVSFPAEPYYPHSPQALRNALSLNMELVWLPGCLAGLRGLHASVPPCWSYRCVTALNCSHEYTLLSSVLRHERIVVVVVV